MIPDSLRRKQVKKPSPQVKRKKTQAKKVDSDDDSDDDEDDNNSFFSWSEKKTLQQNETSTSQVASGGEMNSIYFISMHQPIQRLGLSKILVLLWFIFI